MSAKRAPAVPSGLFSVRDAADYLSCSRQHVYDLIAAGRIPTIDIGIGGAQTRIRISDLDAYLDTRTTPARAASRATTNRGATQAAS